jgi:hypothetical protein
MKRRRMLLLVLRCIVEQRGRWRRKESRIGCLAGCSGHSLTHSRRYYCSSSSRVTPLGPSAERTRRRQAGFWLHSRSGRLTCVASVCPAGSLFWPFRSGSRCQAPSP